MLAPQVLERLQLVLTMDGLVAGAVGGNGLEDAFRGHGGAQEGRVNAFAAGRRRESAGVADEDDALAHVVLELEGRARRDRAAIGVRKVRAARQEFLLVQAGDPGVVERLDAVAIVGAQADADAHVAAARKRPCIPRRHAEAERHVDRRRAKARGALPARQRNDLRLAQDKLVRFPAGPQAARAGHGAVDAVGPDHNAAREALAVGKDGHDLALARFHRNDPATQERLGAGPDGGAQEFGVELLAADDEPRRGARAELGPPLKVRRMEHESPQRHRLGP